MENDFKIYQLKLADHYIFPSLEINFLTDDVVNDRFSGVEYPDPFSSVIIGLNGSGKSNLLRAIIDIFRELHDFKTLRQRKAHIHGFFSFTYIVDGYMYNFSNCEDINQPRANESKTVYYFAKNSVPCDASDLPLPGKILASTIMLTDKFLVLGKNQAFDNYNYLGVRRTASTAGTRTYVKKTVEYVVNSLERERFIEELHEILKFLSLQRSCIISYDVKYRKDIFDHPINDNTLKLFFDSYRKEYEQIPESQRSFAWFGYQYYLTIKDDGDLMVRLSQFCLRVQQNMQQKRRGSPTQIISYDIFNRSSIQQDYKYIKHLTRLDLLSFPNIIFKKDNEQFDFEESSSGEANFISSVLGILANIEPNSVILIDEPEISLHPNWQMKYVSVLKKMLGHHTDAHIIITTHSHFIVSDLHPSSSSVINFAYKYIESRDKKIKHFSGVILPSNTYGWSAEQILLEVFKTPTTRNYFIADKVGDILELVSMPDRNDTLIKQKVQDLISDNIINLSNEDPLKPVIDKLIEKYG